MLTILAFHCTSRSFKYENKNPSNPRLFTFLLFDITHLLRQE